jgi:16S rRNA (cytosine967-C5)-methyltransferase
VIAPARRAAFAVVSRVFDAGAYADRALASAVAGLDARDRALAQRLAYGAVQRRRTLDYGIEALSGRQLESLDPPVRAALRLAAYELLDGSAPARAVVHDAVELTRRARCGRATGFVNAVARRLAREFGALVAALPDGPLKESYPDWIFDCWLRDFGREQALELMHVQNGPGELVVRSCDPEVGEATDLPNAYRVTSVDAAALAAGRIWPQSRGSQLAALALSSQAGERVLDACAAPGGKATMLQGEVTAVELNPGRARELAANVERLGATNVRVVNADVRELPESGFDRALVDAPCSGLGVLGRRPDLRWRGRPLPELQGELLAAAAERVRPGGTIVYSVCTLNADENEAVVERSGLRPLPLGEEWPRYAHPRRPEFLLTTPHRHGTSGFFIARLRVE